MRTSESVLETVTLETVGWPVCTCRSVAVCDFQGPLWLKECMINLEQAIPPSPVSYSTHRQALRVTCNRICQSPMDILSPKEVVSIFHQCGYWLSRVFLKSSHGCVLVLSISCYTYSSLWDLHSCLCRVFYTSAPNDEAKKSKSILG